MMDKTAYFAELEKELKGLSEEDRQNIVAYYYEYMIDVEAETEAEIEPNNVEDVLGSPHTLAAQIKADIAMAPLIEQSRPTREPVDHVATNTEPTRSNSYAQQPRGQQQANSTPYTGTTASPSAPTAPTTMPMPAQAPASAGQKSGIGVVWAVVLAILAIPLGLPLAIALFALIFSLLMVVFAILISFAATVLGLFIVGIVATISGFILLLGAPPVGVFYIGSGLALIGITLLFAVGLWKLSQLVFMGLAKLFNAIRKKIVDRKQVVK